MPTKDIIGYTKEELVGNLYASLGGRAAEDVIYGNEEVTSGCGSDLVKATQISKALFMELGMGDWNFMISTDIENLSDELRA